MRSKASEDGEQVRYTPNRDHLGPATIPESPISAAACWTAGHSAAGASFAPLYHQRGRLLDRQAINC